MTTKIVKLGSSLTRHWDKINSSGIKEAWKAITNFNLSILKQLTNEEYFLTAEEM